ncbi:MAG: glycoside hydrolase family 127 protein [Bacteroidetes bacterium]|nr:glycoside hydrolase family 127 protein [Bacteroidota bacterium]
MKKPVIALILLAVLFIFTSCQEERNSKDYKIRPVSFTKVDLTDNFWKSRLETNNRVTIPFAFEQCEETGRLKNFRVAGGLEEGGFSSRYPFDDSDVFKIMEGAAYSLQEFPDDSLDAYLDTLISWIAAAQEKDGYLYTYRTILGEEADTGWVGTQRWEKVNHHSHELYNLGHMYEAAVAHYNATGRRNFLDIAIKSADLVYQDFGKGKIEKYPGHQEIEIGLVRLYRTTGDERYLELARFFLDTRQGGDSYNQAHESVTQQREAVGHSVRACYMYAGMADVASMTGDLAYIQAIDSIWNDVVSGKLYITGGIGSVGSHEGFGEPYDLPNATAYCETCAGIANVLWNHRMFLLTGDSKYIDILERSLYNNVLSGVALEGNLFFYPNRLESHGKDSRSEWFACACCPSNISRFIPSVQGYIYAEDDRNIYVNLYVSSLADIELKNAKVKLIQKSLMPWEGESLFEIEPDKPATFTLRFRVPGWATGEVIPSDLYTTLNGFENQPDIFVNGEKEDFLMDKGYAVIERQWQAGDKVEVFLPMEVLFITAHEKVPEDTGKVAIQRGPLVYCAEWTDQADSSVMNLEIDPSTAISTDFNPDLLGGLVMLQGSGNKDFTMIPYYAWAHRGPGEMAVWIKSGK